MDLKRILPILLIVGVFIYGGMKIKGTVSHSVKQHTTAVFDPSSVKRSLGQYIRQPRAEYKTLVEKSTDVPKECVEYFDQLQSLDLLALGRSNGQIQYQQMPSPEQGCVVLDDGFQTAEKAFLEKCFPVDGNRSEVISDECSHSLFMLRSTMTKVLLKSKPLSEVGDLRQLSDLLFAEFSGSFNHNNPPDFKRIQAVANRMLEVNPNLYVAAKVAAYSDVFSGISQKGVNSDEIWQRAEASLARAQRMNPDDPALGDAVAATVTHGFEPKRTIEYASRLVEKDPNDAKAHFLLALGQWRGDDRNGSVQTLIRAIQLDPNNEGYKSTLHTITQPEVTSDSFSGSLTIGISSDDFNE